MFLAPELSQVGHEIFIYKIACILFNLLTKNIPVFNLKEFYISFF